MNVRDDDFELLETYLDDELAVDQAQSLWKRLADEPRLAQTLQSLRRERTQRIALWQSMEGSAADHVILQRQLIKTVKRQSLLERVWRTGGISSAAAALLLVGFSMGRVTTRVGLTPAPSTGSQTADIGNGTVLASGGRPASNVDLSGRGSPDSSQVVAIRDANGQLIDTRSFHSQQDARAFTTRFNQDTNSDDLVEPVSETRY